MKYLMLVRVDPEDDGPEQERRPSLDEAIDIAARHRIAWAGSVELYPMWHYTLTD